jgi:hypothetical protein
MKTPVNHVTRELEERRKALLKEASLPLLDADQLARLEDAFPPRCYDHRSEVLEDHLKYAGQVELVQKLRTVFNNREPDEGDPSDMEHA